MTHTYRASLLDAALIWFTFVGLTAVTPQASAQTFRSDSKDTGSSRSVELTDADIANAIADLGSSKFGERQSAYQRLIRGGKAAVPALEKAARADHRETGARCVEALLQIARDKDSQELVIAALERLAENSSDQVASLARRHVEHLKMTDEDRAVAALTAAGVRIFRGRNGDVFSVSIQRDREIAHLRHLPTLQSVRLSGAGVTDAGMKSLVSVKQLHDLSIFQTSVTNRGLRWLKEMGSLQSLSLRNLSITADAMRSVGDVVGLRRLSLHSQVDDPQLEYLKAVRQIDSLYLSEVLISSKSADIINQFGNLRYLSISVEDADDRQCGWLAQIQVPLNLNIDRSPQISVAGWRNLVNAQLRALTLMRTPITDSGLAQLASNSALETLFIFDAPVTDEGLAHLKALKSLRGLSLRNTKVTDVGVARLQEAIPSLRPIRVDSVPRNARRPIPNLPPVRFYVSRITGKKNAHVRAELTDEVFEKLKNEPDVDTVFLGRAEANDEQIAMLAELPIKGIFIKSERISDRGIVALKDHATLESLTLTSSAIGDGCLESIVGIPLLTKLMISNAGVTDQGVQKLIHGLADRGKMTWLSLNACPSLTNDSLKQVSKLKLLRTLLLSDNAGLNSDILEEIGRVRGLTHLRVGGIAVDESDLSHLKGLKLEKLHLNGSQITNQGIEALVTAFPDLRLLDLSGSDVMDSAMASIGKLTQLQSLWISRTEVGDEGLADLADLTELKYIHASETTVSEYGKDQFLLAHPETKIVLK